MSSPYCPHTKRLLERVNRTINGIICSYVNLCHMDWHEFGPYTAFVLNCAQQAADASPYQLVHGRLSVLPHEGTLGAAWELQNCPSPSLVQQCLLYALTRARTAIPHAWECMDTASTHFATPAPVNSNDLVVVRQPLRDQAIAEKLLPSFWSPCEEVCQLAPLTFQLRDWDIASSCHSHLVICHRAHMKPTCCPGKPPRNTTGSVALPAREKAIGTTKRRSLGYHYSESAAFGLRFPLSSILF